MRASRLLRAILILALLYGGAGLVWFSLLPPYRLAALYERLPAFLRVYAPPEGLGMFAMREWQGLLLAAWSLPVALAWCLALAGGIFFAWLLVYVFGLRYRRRLRPGAGLAGAQSTIGDLARPVLPHAPLDVRVQVQGVTFTKAQRGFAEAVMGLIAARPDAYAGDGHQVGLYQHTLNVLRRAAKTDGVDALLVLGVIAHDLGKLTAYRRVGEEWHYARDHGSEGGRLMLMLPEFHALNPVEAEVIHAAVRYEHCPDRIPQNIGRPDQARALLERLKAVDRVVTAEEKKAVLEKHDPTTELMRVFYARFGSLPFFRKGLPKGTHCLGWRYNKRLFFKESALREYLYERLDRDLAAALGRGRKGGTVHPITQHLLEGFAARGELVTSITYDGTRYSLPPAAALWRVWAGSMEFNGVFILEMPEGPEFALPEHSGYKLYPLAPVTPELAALGTTERVGESQAERDAREGIKQRKAAKPAPPGHDGRVREAGSPVAAIPPAAPAREKPEGYEQRKDRGRRGRKNRQDADQAKAAAPRPQERKAEQVAPQRAAPRAEAAKPKEAPHKVAREPNQGRDKLDKEKDNVAAASAKQGGLVALDVFQ